MHLFIFLFVQPKKDLKTGLDAYKVKQMWAKCEIVRIVKKHHYLKLSLHLTTFHLIITHITFSIFSLEGEESVPLDTVITSEFFEGPRERPEKHK